MLSETFSSDETFQLKILRLMTQDVTFYLTAKELIKPEYFTNRALAWYFQEIIDHATDNECLPDPDVLKHRLQKALNNERIQKREEESYCRFLLQFFDPKPIANQDYIKKDTIEFCKAQATKKVFYNYSSQLVNNDASEELYRKIVQEMERIILIGDGVSDLGISYFVDFPETIRRRQAEKSKIRISTGIPGIDERIGGGLRAGQLGVWMGGTNVGKSVVLPHCAKWAVINGKKVAYYTLELNAEDVCERFDASFSAIEVDELGCREAEVQQALQEAAKKYGDSLRIKYYPTGEANINDIYLHVKSLQASGFKPDLIVIDYADLLKSPVKYDNEYDSLGAIYKALRGMAGRLCLPIWTATQTNRTGYREDIADLDVMGDSFQKAQIADIVISLNSSRELYAANILMLFICKNRNGKKWIDEWVRTNYNKMWFVDPLQPQVPEDLKEHFRQKWKNAPKKKDKKN